MASDRRDSDEARRICLDVHLKEDERGRYMVCALSGIRFDPGTMAWRADHWPIPWALGGRNTPDNLRPVLTKYDAEPGGHAAQVNRGVKKGKRVRDKHLGARAKGSTFRKAPEGWRYDWKKRRMVRVDSDEQ